jgi:hypothetical protein
MKKSKTNYFILVGDKDNWKVSLEKQTWGFSDKRKGSWNSLNENDGVAFYVTSPIKKIIGYGKVKEKFISNEILFHDEKLLQCVIWKNRFKFKIEKLVDEWENGIPPPIGIMLNVGKKPISNNIFQSIKKNIIKT